MNELVSIVVPVYNMGESIETCVISLCEQDYKNIEIILVDDGSKDDSYERCMNLSKKDSRIITYHTENRGSGPARNYGIEHSNGRYIYFPDADDYLEPNAISVMVEAMNSSNYDLVVFGYKSLNQDGKEVFKKEYPAMNRTGDEVRADYSDYMGSSRKYGIQGAPWNKFFDLAVIKENGVEYPPLRRHQDEGFISRYMCHAKHVCFIPDVLYVHYLNDLKKEWAKYPVDYYDVVRGLYQTRKETILTWNIKDKKTAELITTEYICNVIKSCELTWSPKAQLVGKERKVRINKYIHESGVMDFAIPAILGRYQRTVLDMVRKGQLNRAVWLMSVKVFAEGRGLLQLVRR